MIDRFNNPNALPKHQPFDDEHGGFQGGTFNGLRKQLDYLRDLGVGAIWMTPVLRNCQNEPNKVCVAMAAETSRNAKHLGAKGRTPSTERIQALAKIAEVRAKQPALRYGRQYFRPLSGDGVHFGISLFSAGVLAFSRVLSDQKVLVVANTNTQSRFQGEVIIDAALNPAQANYEILFSNIIQPSLPGQTLTKSAGSVGIHEVNGVVTNGPARTLLVTLQPMEVQILRKAR